MNEQLFWYVARASGIVAWALLAGSVALGLLLSTKLLGKRPPPSWLASTHRWCAGLAVVFTAVHIAGLVGDSYLYFGPASILVPFASTWKPGAVALGVVALYLLVAIEVTSLFMRRLPRRLWKQVHATSYALALLTSLHSATAGSDATQPLYRAVSIGLVCALVFLIAVRALTSRRSRSGRSARVPAGHRRPVPVGEVPAEVAA